MKIYEIPKIFSWGRYGKIPCSEQYTFTSGATYDDLHAAFFTARCTYNHFVTAEKMLNKC